MASINETLVEEEWDYIVTQQASYLSGELDSYFPWLSQLLTLCKETNPVAKIYLQKTWAYELDSQHDGFARYHNSQQEMYEKLTQCYEYAVQKESIGLIPCADVIQSVRTTAPFLYENGGQSLCRDGFHMSFVYGRYLLAATWAVTLFGINLKENSYQPTTIWAPGEVVEEETLQIMKEVVGQICSNG